MKVMVVEDDTALREIYSIRITAEGYDVVSAGDGEEALAVAVREKPDLILSDVMMPKISGFDMLDILRNTPETANIKVIMMTALSSDDQRTRGENLGADRYLVKSQVGIEDVVNAIHDVLGDKAVAPAPEAAPAPAPLPTEGTIIAPGVPTASAASAPEIPTAQTAPIAAPTTAPAAPTPNLSVAPAPTPDLSATPAPVAPSVPTPSVEQIPPVEPAPAPTIPTAPESPIIQ